MRTSHKPNFTPIGASADEIWQLQAPRVQVLGGVKFGLWVGLPIILVPHIHKKTARVAGTTLNLESTLTLALLRRPLLLVGLMVSGHFLLSQ